MHISEVSFGIKKKGGERNYIMQELYALYDSDKETLLRKKENWKRYVAWLRGQRVCDTKEKQEAFRKSKLFLKKASPKTLAFMVSHIKTKDLYYVLSVCRDRSNRNQSIGKYIWGLRKN